MFRLAWVLVAVTALPMVAAAGPIYWSFRAEVEYAANYGDRFHVNLMAGETVGTSPGEIGSAFLFNSTGASRPEPGEYGVSYHFGVKVTLIDVASGRSADFQYQGYYATAWSYQEWERDNPNAWRWDWEQSAFGDVWNRQTADLGNNRYKVWTEGGGSGQFPNGVLVVEVEALNTPEPGTLVLAGVGLAGIGLRLRRHSIETQHRQPDCQ